MDATLSFLDLAGAIALFLLGIHMVQSGVQRAFGSDLDASWRTRSTTGSKPALANEAIIRAARRWSEDRVTPSLRRPL